MTWATDFELHLMQPTALNNASGGVIAALRSELATALAQRDAALAQVAALQNALLDDRG